MAVELSNALPFTVTAPLTISPAYWGTPITRTINDNFADAIMLPSNGKYFYGDTTDFTLEDGEPGQASPSAWHKWFCPNDWGYHEVSFDTIGSSFDTYLIVYTGTNLGDLAQVASDDDSGGNYTSALSFPPTPGTLYYIRVSGYASGDYGPYVLYRADIPNP